MLSKDSKKYHRKNNTNRNPNHILFRIGFEPTTSGFSAQRSSTELSEHYKNIKNNTEFIKKKLNQIKIKCFQVKDTNWSNLYLGKVPRIKIAHIQKKTVFIVTIIYVTQKKNIILIKN